MKGVFIAALIMLLAGFRALAGEPATKNPSPGQAEPWFRDREFDLSFFGDYSPRSLASSSHSSERFTLGGGVQLTYFPLRNFGFGLEGSVLHSESGGITNGVLSAEAILRLPFETIHLAPYITAGLDGFFGKAGFSSREREFSTEDANLGGHIGGGFEYRFTPTFGVFTDGRYFLIRGERNDLPLVRAGINFAF